MDDSEWTRREFLRVSAQMGAGMVVAGADLTGTARPAQTQLPPAPTSALPVTLKINGAVQTLAVDARSSLLDVLREQLHLTGTKKGCNHGACGACTVLVDGRRINACLTLAVMCDGAEITTIEGLARGDELHPLQAAFLSRDGFQCGYCTPGQIVSGVACIAEGHVNSDAEIREWMSGNICRCGAYPNIVAAIKDAAGRA